LGVESQERTVIRSHIDLTAWQVGMELARDVYRVAQALPRTETFELGRQIRRAAVSFVADIAEGYGRGNRGEYLQVLRIAQGSLQELETELLPIQMLGLAAGEPLEQPLNRTDRVGRLLNRLIRAIAHPRRPV
jgi:four helix bundle protein